MSLKSLAKQTIIYGASTILLRMASWLLAPYYSFSISKEAIGDSSNLLSIIAFLNILYMMGMETSYFRFVKSNNSDQIYKKTLSIVFFNSILWSFILLIFASPIVNALGYPGKEIYVYLFTSTLFFENLCNIPFAQLRQENKALRFISFKALFIFMNIGLNIFLISFVLKGSINLPFTVSNDPVELIFWANLIPWFIIFIYFSPKISQSISWSELTNSKELFNYSWPLLLVGTAGMINEVVDRPMLKYLLPGTLKENAAQVGIYSTIYKLSIIMTLAIQAFRMGAEPLFFKLAEDKSSKKIYAIIMDFFVIACSIILVITSLNRNLIATIIEKSFSEAIDILPILLLANLFLGMYYNTSIWYKATNNTMKGAYISIAGAIITLGLNWILIPHLGYFGSAWTTLVCYFSMYILSLYWGKKYYPIPYNNGYNFLWIGVSLAFSSLGYFFLHDYLWLLIGLSLLYLIIALFVCYKRFIDIREHIV
jgi:O-antigen/teichoic acid export membrane protein